MFDHLAAIDSPSNVGLSALAIGVSNVDGNGESNELHSVISDASNAGVESAGRAAVQGTGGDGRGMPEMGMGMGIGLVATSAGSDTSPMDVSVTHVGGAYSGVSSIEQKGLAAEHVGRVPCAGAGVSAPSARQMGAVAMQEGTGGVPHVPTLTTNVGRVSCSVPYVPTLTISASGMLHAPVPPTSTSGMPYMPAFVPQTHMDRMQSGTLYMSVPSSSASAVLGVMPQMGSAPIQLGGVYAISDDVRHMGAEAAAVGRTQEAGMAAATAGMCVTQQVE